MIKKKPLNPKEKIGVPCSKGTTDAN